VNERQRLEIQTDAGPVSMWGRGGPRGPSDLWIGHEVVSTYLWERYPPRIEAAVDIGGHIGWWTRLLKARYPGARIAVVEPDDESFELLERNVGALSGVTLHHAACGYIATPMSIARHAENSGGVCLVRPEDGPGLMATGWTLQDDVPLMTLEAVVEQLTEGPIDLLKCDCEGGEYDIFRNASLACLRKVRNLIGEHHGTVELFRDEIGGRIESAGFSLTCIPHPDPGVKDVGMFWASRSH
jgi:FkbM family methyltransferase